MRNLYQHWRNRRVCGCGHIWCKLDTMFCCQVQWICDKHDRRILGED